MSSSSGFAEAAAGLMGDLDDLVGLLSEVQDILFSLSEIQVAKQRIIASRKAAVVGRFAD